MFIFYIFTTVQTYIWVPLEVVIKNGRNLVWDQGCLQLGLG